MRKRIAIWVAMLMIIASIPAYAASDAAEYIDISVNGTEYLKVTPETEVIVGDIDLENADIRILTLNGNKLENVGTKSGVLDDQGRTVLEARINKQGDGYWTVYLNYHAGDDPVAANRDYGFEFPKLVFKASESSSAGPVQTPKAPAISSLKAAPSKKAFKVTWKSGKADSYEVQYSLDSKFKKGVVTKKLSAKSLTAKKLKSGKKYYVRVRSIVKYTDDLDNEIPVPGAWKKTSCKVK